MTSQMIANGIIVFGFFSAVVFLFNAAAATALAWFKIDSRVEDLSDKVGGLDVDLSGLTQLLSRLSQCVRRQARKAA